MNDGPANHFKYVVINGLGPAWWRGRLLDLGPRGGRGAVGVAAMFYPVPNFPEDFSSPGPTTIFFDKAGNRLAPPRGPLQAGSHGRRRREQHLLRRRHRG